MTAVVAAAPRPLMVLRLVAGRGAFRGSTQLMAVALLVVWGTTTYGHFSNAVGVCSWLLFLPTAAEKAALKLLPRTRATTAQLARLTLRIAATPVLVLLLGLVVVLLIAPRSTVTLYLTAATWSSGTGLLMTVSGLHRLRGRPALDAAAFGALSALVLGTTALTLAVGWTPHDHLRLLAGGLLVIIAGTVGALPPTWLRAAGGSGRRILPAFGRSTWLLGITDLLHAVALSSIFVVLAGFGRLTDSGPFYLALLASAALCMLLLYRLKLHQPLISARQRGHGAGAGRARASGLLLMVQRGGLAFAAVLALVLAMPPARAVLADETSYLSLAALVLVETGMAIMVMNALFLLENTDSRVLALIAAGALTRLVATVLCALALVPAFGASGGFCALVLALAVEAGMVRRALLRRHPELANPK